MVFLDQQSKLHNFYNFRLESVISSLCDVLKTTFEEVVAIQCLQYEEDTMRIKHQESFINVQKIGCRRLLDVGDFLEVKAMQNVAMSSYPFTIFSSIMFHFLLIFLLKEHKLCFKVSVPVLVSIKTAENKN